MAKANSSILQNNKSIFDISENDRISKLPDPILSHILSFLPTKYSVRTSCLSRRWRFIWTFVSVLYLDDLTFEPAHPLKKRRKNGEEVEPFKKFMNKVLILSSHICVRKFKLALFSDYKTSNFHSWIWAAVTHNIEELNICSTYLVELPTILYNSATLVVLKLHAGAELNVPENSSLPSLKVVHLQGHTRLYDADINRLLCASPVLEELQIKRSSQDSKRYSVLSSSLKTLIIRYNAWAERSPYQVVIDAPKLEYLEFVDPLNEGVDIEFKNTASIVKATLRLRDCNVSEIMAMGSSLWSFCNVKVLNVHSYMLKAGLSDEHDTGSVFNHLTKLVLSYCLADLPILPHILKRMPTLEVLVLNKVCSCKNTFTCEDWKEEKSDIQCLKYTLKTLQLGSFIGNELQLSILEYFMENATVLNEVRTSADSTKRKESEKAILKKLFTFPRCSNAFKIIIS